MGSRAVTVSIAALALAGVVGAACPALGKSAGYEIQARCPCTGPAVRTFWSSMAERLACVDHVIAELATQGWPAELLARDRVRELKSGCGDPRLQCDGTSARTCPRRMRCDVADSSCRPEGAPGKCVPRKFHRRACSGDPYPLCGCDGKTYPNDCRLRAAGVALRHVYACERGCGGPDRVGCPAGQTCWAFLGCDGGDAWG